MSKRVRVVVNVVAGTIGAVAFFVGFFWAAGGVGWREGWAFLLLLTCGQAASSLYVQRRNPELLKRRGTIGKGTKTWDKTWLACFAVVYLAILVVAALDSGRYGWSTMSGWYWAVGAAMYGSFVVIITWAMAANPFFEKTVRIQHDRGHHVIDSGPYRIVRHPGYVGTIFGFLLSPPLLLGSWWALLPAVLASLLLVVRTALEDRTLRRELPGYEDYARRVRYRLMPGMW